MAPDPVSVVIHSLEVTAIELIAGTDPSMAIMDGGGFPGIWPPGYSVEIRDPATGDWTVIGDLSAGNRIETTFSR